MDFEILINDKFLDIYLDDGLNPVENKHVLSLINDFEDGKWRYGKFQNFIWDNIAETALSERERSILVGKSHSMMVESAKNLRLTDKKNDISKGSELAEVVLYGIMKYHYGALSVVPKIFYKQSEGDNAKGADSVHIVVTEDDGFTLWFGEAKFYNNIENARLSKIIKSVENSLDSSKLKKENSIITNLSDLDSLGLSSGLLDKIKSALSPKASIDQIKPILNIPILLLHECEITNCCKELDGKYRKEIRDYHYERAHKYFSKQIDKLSKIVYKYNEIKFHLILFPVPSKRVIIDKFVSNVEHYKGQ